MLAKNYHVVLGVFRDESQTETRTPYQEMVSHADPEWTEAWPDGHQPVSLFGQPEQTRPSFDALHDRYLRNFTGRNVPKAERAESLTLDVALSPAEALRGCIVPVGVPVFTACPECNGTGRMVPFRCTACSGSGLMEEEHTLRVHVPPRVPPGTMLELPLEMLGIGNLYLRLHVSISEAI